MREPSVQYARTADGVNISFSVVGSGPVLLEMPASGSGGLGGLKVPAFDRYYSSLTERLTVVTYDARGFGNSQRGTFQYSQESHIADLEAVVQATGLDSFSLFAAFHSGAAGVAYAANHPNMVRSLVAWHVYLDGERYNREADIPAARALVEARYELYIVTAVANMHPPTKDDERALQAGLRTLDVPSLFAYLEASHTMLAVEHARAVRVPTLVLHRDGSSTPPLSFSQEVAALVPGARLQLLRGDSFAPGFGDVEETVDAIAGFVESSSRSPDKAGPRAGFRAILFTDVVSSTPLLSQLRDAKMREVMRQHDAIMEAAVAAHGGRVIKTIGDAFMADFVAPSQAVLAAIDAQRGIRDGFQGSDIPVRIRIGINAGEPIEEHGDLHGVAVVIAKRLEGLADPGTILVSDVVRQATAGKDFEFHDRGPLELKGLDEPVRAWAVRWE